MNDTKLILNTKNKYCDLEELILREMDEEIANLDVKYFTHEEVFSKIRDKI